MNGRVQGAEKFNSADAALDTDRFVRMGDSGPEVVGTTMLKASAPAESADPIPEQFSVTFTQSWLGEGPSDQQVPLFVMLWEYPTDTEYDGLGMMGRDGYEVEGQHAEATNSDDAEAQFETAMAIDWDQIATETVRAFEVCDEMVLEEYHEKARSVAEVVIDVFGPDRITV